MKPTLVLELDTTPGRSLAPNVDTGFDKGRHHAAAREKARLRKHAEMQAKSLINAPGAQLWDLPLYSRRARVRVVVGWERVRSARYPNGRKRNLVDRHDSLPMMFKGVIDGLVDAEILEDDSDLDATFSQEHDPEGRGYTRITILEADDAQ